MLVRVETTMNKGRGVFACADIAAGALLEEAHVIEIPKEQVSLLKSTFLFNYYFKWSQNSAAIGLGYASLYNHSYTPNARYVKKMGVGTIAFLALEEIKKDQEITINYNGHPDDKAPVWFDDLTAKNARAAMAMI